MKKFCFYLILFFALFLVGCGQKEQPKEEPKEPVKEYTVNWYDDEGSLLKSETLKENTKLSNTYNKQDTMEWDYTFEGWATSLGGSVVSLPNIKENCNYYAVVSKVKQVYKVSFDTGNGTKISPVEKEYGESFDEPSDVPTLEGYKFVGWVSSKDGNTPVEFPITVKDNVTIYAKYNEVISIKGLLEELIEGYDLNPLSFIPESLQIGASNNSVLQNPQKDYSSFVSASSIRQASYGEQLNMLMDNINESMKFHVALSAIEAISSTAVSAFNNYLDKNPSDTASHEFLSGEYTCKIEVTTEAIEFTISYTKSLPIFSEQSVEIVLSMDRVSKEKIVRCQIGEVNKLKYIINENTYEFGIEYLGVRTAYTSIKKENGVVEGHVYEYLTVKGVGTKSACDFYIDKDFARVVGNKASGFIGFTGYINELYDVTTGKLLGYEVQETLSKITYNTLWFNLSDVNGINSIKAITNSETNALEVYINNSSSVFTAKNVGGFSLKTASRRFDIEFRKQYFYQYDALTKSYTKYEVSVPMLFVQQEHLETFSKDVLDTNKGCNLSISLSSAITDIIINDYNTLIPTFITNKETITEEYIKTYIG